VRAHQADYPVALLCRMLAISASGYYAWIKRPMSKHAQEDAAYGDRIKAIFERSRRTYGRPRVHAELRSEGTMISPKRVGRLMRERDLQGVTRRRRYARRDRANLLAPDLVDRNFTASAPDQLWVADITYVPAGATFLFLAVVLDAFSRRIVGWAMENHLRTELVLKALDMAICRRSPSNVIHHSDQGTQYTSIEFGLRCLEAGVRPSMGTVGDCYDNAMCESFFATLECELLARNNFKHHAEAELAIFDFIEGWYNPHRRHSSLAYHSPAFFERQATPQTAVSNP
jgi:putative transposase